jgi:hypothetical protein
LAQQLQPRTRSGLLPEARHLILPKGIRSSGFPSVRETCRSIGIEFDRWQQDLNRCLLAKDAHGLYAADTAVLSIARQVGKTFDVGAVAFALCIATPGLTVVWTAHRFKVSRESFNEMRGWAKSPLLAPHIDYDEITTGAGNECIPFRNGSRIVFAARERGAIRGFTKVAVLVLDEAQILTEAALSDLVPTTNQAANPLIILMGTPPKPTDPSEVFVRLRQEALDGESSDVLYVELSADADADPGDRAQWRKANPSHPGRTPERAILRLKKLLSPEDFLREGLGIWPAEPGSRIIPTELWQTLADADAQRPTEVTFALVVNRDRTRSAIGFAGLREDGRVQVGMSDWRAGTSWAVARLVELKERWGPVGIAVSTRSEALLLDLEKAGIKVPEDADEPKRGDLKVPTSAEDAAAYGVFVDAARNDRLRHLDDTPVNTGLAQAKTRPMSGGATWDDRHGEVAPLRAVTHALWLFESWAHLVHDFDPAGQVF